MCTSLAELTRQAGNGTIDVLRVSSSSPIPGVAGAIAKSLRDQPAVAVQAIGLVASYRALKATIVARRFLMEDGLDLVAQPAFVKIWEEGDRERTAMRLSLWAMTRDRKGSG